MSPSAPKPKLSNGLLSWTLLSAFCLFGLSIAGGYAVSTQGWGLQALSHLGRYDLVILAAGLLMGVISIPFSLTWWSKLDEGQREAHKWAWMWGGTLGLSVPIPLAVICLFSAPGEFFDPSLSGEQVFAAAYGTIFGFAMLGYGIAWGVWWLKHR